MLLTVSCNANVADPPPEREVRAIDGTSFSDCPANNSSDVPYSPEAVRLQSGGLFNYGIAFVQLDPAKDGVLILSNGQDLAPQPLVIMPAVSQAWPVWYSENFDFQGRLAVGDIDADGYPDVAVPVFGDRQRKYAGGELHIYANEKGQLMPAVAQRIAVGGGVLEASFGDADADGDLDLATSVLGKSGMLPGPPPSGSGATLIFSNEHGRLLNTPAWTSDGVEKCAPPYQAVECNFVFGLLFADTNQDGIMDLVANGNRLRIYEGRLVDAGTAAERTVIASTPAWQSKATWDVGYDVSMGWHDQKRRTLMLAVSAYAETGGGGPFPFRVYIPEASDKAAWSSAASGSGGGVLLHDVDNDSKFDLVAGSQGVNKQTVRIFMGSSTGFEKTPQFCSGTSSSSRPRTILCSSSLFFGGTVVAAGSEIQHQQGCEIFSIGEHSAPAADTECETTILPEHHAGYVFTLARKASRIEAITAGDASLPRNQVAFVPGTMTVSVGKKLKPATPMKIVYRYLLQPDIVVADMDPLCSPGIFQYQD